MNEDTLKQQAAEIVRRAIREEGALQAAELSDALPLLADYVSFDLEELQGRIRTELQKRTANPINILLGVVGLRIINTNRPLPSLEDDSLAPWEEELVIDRTGDGGESLRAMLCLDEAGFEAAVREQVRAAVQAEEQAAAERAAHREAAARLHTQLEKAEGDFAQLRADYAAQRQAVMERTQHMFSLCGQEPDDPRMAQQLEELLEDLDVRIYWPDSEAPFPKQAMFTTLKCADPSRRRTKPCLADDSGILLKGVCFVAAEC